MLAEVALKWLISIRRYGATMETKLNVLFSVGDTLSAATTHLLFWEEWRACFMQGFFLAVFAVWTRYNIFDQKKEGKKRQDTDISLTHLYPALIMSTWENI